MVPDYYLYVAVAREYPARAVQEIVCRYRMHAGSMSRSTRSRLYEESLLIIDRWATQLDPRVAEYRRMTYSTGLALEEMRSLGTARIGLVRMLKQGFHCLASFPTICPHEARHPDGGCGAAYWRTTEFASEPV